MGICSFRVFVRVWCLLISPARKDSGLQQCARVGLQVVTPGDFVRWINSCQGFISAFSLPASNIPPSSLSGWTLWHECHSYLTASCCMCLRDVFPRGELRATSAAIVVSASSKSGRLRTALRVSKTWVLTQAFDSVTELVLAEERGLGICPWGRAVLCDNLFLEIDRIYWLGFIAY